MKNTEKISSRLPCFPSYHRYGSKTHRSYNTEYLIVIGSNQSYEQSDVRKHQKVARKTV